MAEFNPIGDVGRTLRSLIQEQMQTWTVDDHQIALASPAQFEADEVGLSLHLYHLTENEHLANEFPGMTERTSSTDMPLILELYYLVTAHPPNGETVSTADTLEQHRMLSKAVQTLSEHAIITDPDLEGSLAGRGPLHVSINTDATDRIMDVWSSFQDTPYLPSVSYVVSPVVIETPDVEVPPRVVEAHMEYLSGTSHSTGAER